MWCMCAWNPRLGAPQNHGSAGPVMSGISFCKGCIGARSRRGLLLRPRDPPGLWTRRKSFGSHVITPTGFISLNLLASEGFFAQWRHLENVIAALWLWLGLSISIRLQAFIFVDFSLALRHGPCCRSGYFLACLPFFCIIRSVCLV